jgi:hypothetical protein
MKDIIIFLGHGAGPNAIRANLVDLATLGLVTRFHWIDTASAGNEIEVVEHDEAEGVRIRLQRVSDALRVDGSRRVLLVALDEPDEHGSTVDLPAVMRWTNAIDDILSSSSERVHLVLPRLPLPRTAPARMVGWTTLVLSPEDSDSPSDAKDPQRRADGPDALARYAAPAVAGLTGLWAGASETPVLDGPRGAMASGEGGVVRLTRVYHRRIDTTDMEAGIRRRTLDVTERVPQPVREGNRRVTIADDDAEITGKMAEGFARSSAPYLLSELRPSQNPESSKVGAWETLKRFFSFFFKAVIGTPGDWAAAGSATVQRGFARMVQNTLYGQDSAIEVVCGRHSGARRSGSIDEIGAASSHLRERLDRADDQIRIGEPPSLALMWRAYANTCLTLVDGGEREQGVLAAPRDHYGNGVVVERPELAVPDAGDTFNGEHHTLRSMLGDSLGDTTIAPYDPHGAAAYAGALDYVADKTTDRSVLNLQSRFDEWRRRNSTSFAWRIGERLSGFMEESRARAAGCAEQLRQIQAELEALGGDDGEASRRLARTLRILTGLWFVLSLITVYLVVAEYEPGIRIPRLGWSLTWNWGLLAFLVVTLVMLLIQFLVFARAQRGIFDRITRRTLLAHNERIAAENLGTAIGDVERCARSYAQHQSWSAILGRALSSPFGSSLEAEAPLRIPHAGLPRSTVIAEADIDERRALEAVQLLRDRVFPPSWAEDSLENLITAARDEVQASGVMIPDDSQLFGAMGRGSNSPLDRIATVAVDEELDRSREADAVWARALEDLSRSGDADALVRTLRMWEDGVEKEIPSHRLFDGLDVDSRVGFTGSAMTAMGHNKGGTEVDPEVSSLHREPSAANGPVNTLSKSVTVVQYGRTSQAEWIASEVTSNDPLPRRVDPVFPRDEAGVDEPGPRRAGISLPGFGDGLV